MKFTEYPYARPDIDAMEAEFRSLVQAFTEASSFAAQVEVMAQINRLRIKLSTLGMIVHVRHTINTNDEFYKSEQDFWDQNSPRIDGLVNEYYRAITSSPYRTQLEQKWGKQLFRIAEMTLKTFSPEVVPDLQEENALVSEYAKLMSSAQILFDGEECNFSQLIPYTASPDRELRKRASEAKWAFFQEHADKLDEIYDRLVQVRTRIAKKLGYDNFIELGYARLGRTDYNSEMVAKFRQQVKELIVPVATKLRERQARRIGVDTLRYYDEGFGFATGNPYPQGDSDWIVQRGEQMYRELSPETDEFFTFMQKNELMDLVAKKGKRGGGYCEPFAEYEAPFIFSNFNGTFDDVTTLTHEAGHAFQIYSSRFGVPEYADFPTLEACEIHSMSMEFFTWPWMELFFEHETEKFKFMHLSDALLLIPYLVSVDEFQHFVYAHPEATPQERKQAWREIERKYLPHRNYEGNEFLENGGFWQHQLHIYHYPFYFIDYSLAQICAFQFWKRSNENREQAWADYLHLCKLGGSLSFTELVKEANLISPFDTGCVQSVIGEIEAWLNMVDDCAL
ncbi:M3 family oligoendopeptidase [Alicyclobacillus dauci]|uniref:M3 family oligoendopeptidase n=1 Tax=Alicyclobacillus dauci TaxID=1475485 RepID=A0ABY6YZB1_9BACL|nr:M3 family oligoendopeptidase [Alicyclobacillus dauci]WAH35959.1 M3 family oligoendopeptidase [Alicyclobacillus dauci]